MNSLLDRVRQFADEVLFPRAAAVDAGTANLGDGLDELAARRLYGLWLPVTLGGLGVTDDAAHTVVEHLAGADLSTTFVWLQHQGVARRLSLLPGELRDTWVPRMASGDVRTGVGSGGIDGAVGSLAAMPDGDGWRLVGTVPWISGWGHVDVVLIAAREHGDGDVLWFLIDAPPVVVEPGRLVSTSPTVHLRGIDLVGMDATNTAAATFTDHHVPGARLVLRQPHDDDAVVGATSLRTSASLPLGLAARCARLSGLDWLHDEVATVRLTLDAATAATMPAARAMAADLAWRGVAALAVTTGSPAVSATGHVQRLSREALVLQVFGNHPEVNASRLELLRAKPDTITC